MSITIPMLLPAGVSWDMVQLPGGNYYPANGQINVIPSDVFPALEAGLTSADLTAGVAVSTAAAGTTQGTAAALPTQAGQVYPVTGASGTNGVVIGAADQVTGRNIVIANMAAAVLLIYPPGTGTINGLAASAAFSTVSGHGAVLYCINGATNQWAALG